MFRFVVVIHLEYFGHTPVLSHRIFVCLCLDVGSVFSWLIEASLGIQPSLMGGPCQPCPVWPPSVHVALIPFCSQN